MIPKLFECSRNSLPGKSLRTGGGGDFPRDFGILIFFWEIFLLPSEEIPGILGIFGISGSQPCGFQDFGSLWEYQDLLHSWNSLLGSEFNNFYGFLGKFDPKIPLSQGSALPQNLNFPGFLWIFRQHDTKFLLFSGFNGRKTIQDHSRGVGAEKSKDFPQFWYNSTPKFGEEGDILRETP